MCISGGGGGAVSGGRDLADITQQGVTREVPGLRDFPSPAGRRMSGRGAGDGDFVAAALVALRKRPKFILSGSVALGGWSAAG